MKKFFSKYSFLVSFIALIAVMGLGLWLGILPLQERVAIQRDEIQKFHTARENRNRQLAVLSELRKQFEVIIRDEHVLNILLTDNQIVDFIRIVEEEARAAQVEVTISARDQGATIVERKPKKEEKEEEDEEKKKEKAKKEVKTLVDEAPFARFLPLNIRVVGSYEQTVLFLHKLETLPIALDVISLAVEPFEEENKPAARRDASNPFVPVLGDASTESTPAPSSSDEERLQATFEVLVYADKKTE